MNNPSRNGHSIRKFYYLSILCLIPGIGVLVAIVLCVYAIAKFKSFPLLLTIVLFTAGGFGLLQLDELYLKNRMTSKDVENNLVLLVPNDLDDIVECLQKYKLKRGEYPDSLQQLEKATGISVLGKDPFLSRHPEAHKTFYFNYHRTSDGYVLFSSGPDEIPNTKDDIYPRRPLQ